MGIFLRRAVSPTASPPVERGLWCVWVSAWEMILVILIYFPYPCLLSDLEVKALKLSQILDEFFSKIEMIIFNSHIF